MKAPEKKFPKGRWSAIIEYLGDAVGACIYFLFYARSKSQRDHTGADRNQGHRP